MASVGQRAPLKSRPRATQTMNDSVPSEGTKSTEKDKDSAREMDVAGSGSGKVAACCFLGIFISYFIYGILQEKM